MGKVSLVAKILIIEDDPKLASHLEKMIRKYEHETYVIEDFDQVIEQFHQFSPELVLLDINLPSFDGFYWCRQIRKYSTCPIIFISARTGEMDQVMALENGGDDYITKPFHSEVVLAKINSQLRRAYGEYAVSNKERIVEKNGLRLYLERLELHFANEKVSLTKKEADILEILLTRYPRVAGREVLLEKLWDDETFVDENTLNVNMTRTRNKLKEIGIENAIETVRGVGYRLQLTW